MSDGRWPWWCCWWSWWWWFRGADKNSPDKSSTDKRSPIKCLHVSHWAVLLVQTRTSCARAEPANFVITGTHLWLLVSYQTQRHSSVISCFLSDPTTHIYDFLFPIRPNDTHPWFLVSYQTQRHPSVIYCFLLDPTTPICDVLFPIRPNDTHLWFPVSYQTQDTHLWL